MTQSARERQVAHGQGVAVEQHGGEQDQRHRQCALGADARAGHHVVADGRHHRRGRRPFLDGVAQGERAVQRQQAPQADEKDAGDERHLHAGDGDDVENAGLADRILCGLGDEVALAGHHGGGDGAGIATDDGVDAARQCVAGAVDCHAEAQHEIGRLGCLGGLDAA